MDSAEPATNLAAFLPELLVLHQANDHTSLWQAFRDLLTKAFPCHRVTLFLGHIEMGEARLVFTDPPLAEPEVWFENRGKNNPFSAWITKHRRVSWYRFSDIVGPPEVFRSTTFYQSFAAIEGWDKGLSGLYWQRDNVAAMFSVYRGDGLPDFDEQEIALLQSLQPWFDAAVNRVQRFHSTDNLRATLEDFNRDMPLGLILLDWQLKPLFANHRAMEHCSLWNHGPLAARKFKVRDAFRLPVTLLDALEGMRERIRLSEPKQLARRLPDPEYCASAHDPRQRARISIAHHGQHSLAKPGFFVLFYEPDPLLDDSAKDKDARKLSELHLLTVAERELVRLVCEGRSNGDIAQELNKSVLTVKTQMNSIFRKLNLRRRAELIARWR
ncbi:MAG: helix-turn-helix transcriptional regulator [Verrucomicrobiota bacterium]|nr:helix-turn-helix transcriptional regulator [Verrucomicrobiota bacterium]